MKKEINSKSRRKWIMGGLAAFASVALLTTGFAVWMVGVTNDKDSNDVDVTVDTAKNASIYFDMKINNTASIKLAESTSTATANKDGAIVKITDAETPNAYDAAPLTLNVTYTIRYGAASGFDFNNIQFSIIDTTSLEEAEKTDGKNYCDAKVASENIKLGKDSGSAFARKTSENLTYIEAPKNIEFTKPSTAVEGKTYFEITDTTSISFKWGSFFGGKDSPATYYNGLENLGTATFEMKDTLSSEITEELNAMWNQMNGKTIKLQATMIKK